MPRKKREVKIYTLDTETIGLDGAIRRIAIYDGKDVHYGYNFSDVEQVLIDGFNQGFRVVCYVHNLEFDARKLDTLFVKGKILWSQCKLISGRYAKIVTKNYTLQDSWRLLPDSLDNLSRSFELEHGKLDLWEEVQKQYPGVYKDKVDFLARCDLENELFLTYLGYDVISLYELIDKVCDIAGITHSIIADILTTASLSRYILKNGYKGQIFKDENRKKTDFEILTSNVAWSSKKPIKESSAEISYIELENFIRRAYHGGRVEVFTPEIIPKDNKILARGYDVNSMYPAVMANVYDVSGVSIGRYFPVGYPQYYDTEYMSKFTFNKWLRTKKGLGFLECTVYIPEQFIPPLPIKNQKLFFPCGYVKGVFTFTELEYAIKNCGVEIMEYYSCVNFTQTFNVFERFINIFSEMKSSAKANGQKALERFSKDIQNVGYGWTALRRDDKTELRDISKVDEYIEDRLITVNEELGYCEIKANVLAKTIQVQIAAYVTSYARLLLLDAARQQAEKGKVYYCDTDSLICESEMNQDRVHKTALGFWDCEKEIKQAVFVQPKVYAINDNIVKFKGVTKARQKQLDIDFYENILKTMKEGSEQYIEVETDIKRLRSLKVAQKKGLDPNELEEINKRINLFNKQKRVMDYVNNTSRPYYFASLEEFEKFNFNVDYTPYLNDDGYLLNFGKGARK